MALSANKFNIVTDKLVAGTYNWSSNGFKMALCTAAAAPIAGDTTFTSGTGTGTATEVANGNGYTSGGVALTGTTIGSNSGSGTTLKTSANFASPTWTSNTANVALRYFVWWNTTVGTGVSGSVQAWWDYGSTLTLAGANGDTLDISGSNFNTSWATVA